MANEMQDSREGKMKGNKNKTSYLSSVIQGTSFSTKIEEEEESEISIVECDRGHRMQEIKTNSDEKNCTACDNEREAPIRYICTICSNYKLCEVCAETRKIDVPSHVAMLNADEMQAAMASVEDLADANASKQMTNEMKSQGAIAWTSEQDDAVESELRSKEAEESEKMKWISSSDQALKQMEDSLPPVHRFALRYRTEIDRPESSLTALSPEALADAMARQQSAEIEAALSEQSEIEAMMLEPEGRMELDAAALVDSKRDERLTSSQRRSILLKCEASYWARRRRLRNERRQRRLQGASWTPYIDDRTGRIFWYVMFEARIG